MVCLILWIAGLVVRDLELETEFLALSHCALFLMFNLFQLLNRIYALEYVLRIVSICPVAQTCQVLIS